MRFGQFNSALFATVTTDASCGAVNMMHDSLMPLAGLVPMVLIQLGEVLPGGVGSGLYGMVVFAVLSVFVAGLMVGRTPEFLGKKIEAREIKYAAVGALLVPTVALVTTAISIVTHGGLASVYNTGAHGFTEVLYAFSSMSNNNGSAFGGLNSGLDVYTILGGVAMVLARFGVIVPVLAVAGSLAKKKVVPAGAGTLPTDTALFVVLLVGTVVLVGALTHLPGLALGPIVEQLTLPVR